MEPTRMRPWHVESGVPYPVGVRWRLSGDGGCYEAGVDGVPAGGGVTTRAQAPPGGP